MNTTRSLSLAALAFAALLPTAIPATAHADDGAMTLTDPPQRSPGRGHEASCGEGTCSANAPSAQRQRPRQGAEANCSGHAAQQRPRQGAEASCSAHAPNARRQAPRQGAEANCSGRH